MTALKFLVVLCLLVVLVSKEIARDVFVLPVHIYRKKYKVVMYFKQRLSPGMELGLMLMVTAVMGMFGIGGIMCAISHVITVSCSVYEHTVIIRQMNIVHWVAIKLVPLATMQ